MSEQIPQGVATISVWTRPKRIAFLVDPVHHATPDKLDQIVRWCSRSWGGRFSAIIPTDGKTVPGEWWSAMVGHDPDVVYSLTPLDPGLVLAMNREILPATILETTPKEAEASDRRHLARFMEIEGVGVTRLPSYLRRTQSLLSDYFFFYLKDLDGKGPETRVVLRNFGALDGTIFMDHAFDGVPHEVFKDGDRLLERVLENTIGSNARVVTPIDLCATPVPAPSFYQPWGAFHLGIGDSVHDFCYAWLCGSWDAGTQSRSWFWLPESYARNAEVLRLVAKWIQRVYWPGPHRSGVVVSYSLDDDCIEQVVSTLSKVAGFAFSAKRLHGPECPLPKRPPSTRDNPHHTERVPLTGNKGMVTFPRPLFLGDRVDNGDFMVDLRIDFRQEHQEFMGAYPSWELPKRLGVAGKFLRQTQFSRVVYDGLPSALVHGSAKTIDVCIPSGRQLIHTYVEVYHDNCTFDVALAGKGSCRFRNLEESDKGSYLRGLVGLFGNLWETGRYFEDPFWRPTFLQMAGRLDDEKAARSVRIRGAIQAFFGRRGGPVAGSPSDVAEMAEFMATRTALRDKPLVYRDVQKLKSDFQRFKGDALKIAENVAWWKATPRFDESKE